MGGTEFDVRWNRLAPPFSSAGVSEAIASRPSERAVSSAEPLRKRRSIRHDRGDSRRTRMERGPPDTVRRVERASGGQMEIVIVKPYAQPPEGATTSSVGSSPRRVIESPSWRAPSSHLTRSQPAVHPPSAWTGLHSFSVDPRRCRATGTISGGSWACWISPSESPQEIERADFAPTSSSGHRPTPISALGALRLGRARRLVRARSSRHLARLPDRCHRGAARTPPGAISCVRCRKVPVSICHPYRVALCPTPPRVEDAGAKRGSVV